MSPSAAFARNLDPARIVPAADSAARQRFREEWQKLPPGLVTIPAEIEAPSVRWLDALAGNAPYLARLALREPGIVTEVMDTGPEPALDRVLVALRGDSGVDGRTEIGERLRRAKRQAALVLALADLGGVWPLERVTMGLSELADACLGLGLRCLLRELAAARKLALGNPDDPEQDCGVVLLGMGKLGAYELNYSSDIDLIILHDEARLADLGAIDSQTLITRLVRDLVRLFEEKTAGGYVFRTDLRLRPDPASTPLSVPIIAAETYYAAVGQNWERAALIKARQVAGDTAVGERFLRGLTPFIWRKHLDFAAIRDIHSIKRQIDARQGRHTGSIAGHNVKLGFGGIREIEFFVQTQQLIWGGRLPALRGRGTVEMLFALAKTGRIDSATAEALGDCYRYLRTVEHRLQMLEDAQTHTLPTDRAALGRFACFMGEIDIESFARRLGEVLETVRGHFRALFQDVPTLAHSGNLVFTGHEDDPATLATLAEMGFTKPERVTEAVRGWHHGRIRAARSARARELLTDLAPRMLRQLSSTIDPDLAFARFDEFLSHLPAGVQLFSMFQRHPETLDLVAEIMGEAPLLSAQLARRPLLLDAVLTGDFFGLLDDSVDEALSRLRDEARETVARARVYEDALDLIRRWVGDWRFQIGVQLLQGKIDGVRAGRDFALIAEAAVAAMLPPVAAEFARSHGRFPGGRFVVLGLGKLGSREMNLLSDLDLIFLYDVPAGLEASDGPRALPPAGYFARLGQRIINALSAPTAEGALYDVDMRLRPSGAAGPIACSREAFERYHRDQAWTWERMALTRGRPVAGDAELSDTIRQLIVELLSIPRDPRQIMIDVDDMRLRTLRARPSEPRPWDCKHRRGGLVDLEFISHALQLIAAPRVPSVIAWNTELSFERLVEAGALSAEDGAACRAALGFWHRLQQSLRVALGKVETADVTPELLDRALFRATGSTDAATRRARLDSTAELVLALYRRLIENPAMEARAALPPSDPKPHSEPPQ